MPKGDQLTGGTKDVNPHYRTVNVSRTSTATGIAWSSGQAFAQTALVDLTTIDTGIAQNVPAGRGSKQIVMELLSVEFAPSSTLNGNADGAPQFMDGGFVNSNFPASHWVKSSWGEGLAISTAQLPVAAGQADTSQPSVIVQTSRNQSLQFAYLPATPFNLVQSQLVSDEYPVKKMDLTDEAGHGILIATQKLYFYAQSTSRLDWEANTIAGSSMTLQNTYSWNIDLQYRWKEVGEAEYLQILIENTTVN